MSLDIDFVENRYRETETNLKAPYHMKMKLTNSFIRVVAFTLVAMTYASRFYGGDSVQDQWIQFRNEVINELNKNRTSYAEDLKILKQQGSHSLSEVQSLGEVIQDMGAQISQLKGKVAQLEQEKSALKKELHASLTKLSRRIDEEGNSRRKADQDIIQEISSELSRAANSVASRPNPPPSMRVRTAESYHLYEVVKGDTLGAISQAFDISLRQLKAFNELTNDTIFVGQKLKIPKD